MKVPGRVEMGAVVGRELHLLDRPALAVRQILGLQPLEELQHARQALLVIDILDGRMSARRIGRHVVLQRHGNIDQSSRHGVSSEFLIVFYRLPRMSRQRLILFAWQFSLNDFATGCRMDIIASTV